MIEAGFQCPHCGSEEIVLPTGPRTSPILVIGSEPEDDDCRSGKPMTTSSGIFKAELAKFQIDYARMRVCLLQNHKWEKDTESKCLEWSVTKALAEAKGKKVVILVGAYATKYFTSYSTSTHNGLITTAMYLPHAKVAICIKPAAVFRSGLGELHFAIKAINKLLLEEGLN